MTKQTTIITSVIMVVLILSTSVFLIANNKDEQKIVNNKEQQAVNSEQGLENGEQGIVESENSVISEETEILEEGEIFVKTDKDVFTLIYPQSWHWVEYDITPGNFLTNNLNIIDPNYQELKNYNDVVLTISSTPLMPFSEEIDNLDLRIEHELEHKQKYDSERYENMQCLKNMESEFDIEYSCLYSKDDVYYRSIGIGFKNIDFDFGPNIYYIVAKSKNPSLVEKFSVEEK